MGSRFLRLVAIKRHKIEKDYSACKRALGTSREATRAANREFIILYFRLTLPLGHQRKGSFPLSCLCYAVKFTEIPKADSLDLHTNDADFILSSREGV